MDKRMITTDAIEEDLPLEGNLRPQTLDEYIGQEKTKKNSRQFPGRPVQYDRTAPATDYRT